MKVYQTDSKGFLVGELIAKNDPLGGGFLIPAGCVLDQPPVIKANQVAQFINGKWQVLPDFQNTEYWLNGQKFKIEAKGIDLPEGATLSEPAELIAAREEQERQAQLKGQLLEIDLKSVRALREYIAAQADAPQYIKDKELAAQTTRAKL